MALWNNLSSDVALGSLAHFQMTIQHYFFVTFPLHLVRVLPISFAYTVTCFVHTCHLIVSAHMHFVYQVKYDYDYDKAQFNRGKMAFSMRIMSRAHFQVNDSLCCYAKLLISLALCFHLGKLYNDKNHAACCIAQSILKLIISIFVTDVTVDLQMILKVSYMYALV